MADYTDADYFKKRVGPTAQVPGGGVPLTSQQRTLGSSMNSAFSWDDGWEWVKDNAGNLVQVFVSAGEKIAKYAKEHGVDIATAALAAQQAIAAAKASERSQGHSNDAINFANDQWKAGEDFRLTGKAGMLNRSTPDLSSVYVDSQNPFASVKRPLPPSTPVVPKMPPVQFAPPPDNTKPPGTPNTTTPDDHILPGGPDPRPPGSSPLDPANPFIPQRRPLVPPVPPVGGAPGQLAPPAGAVGSLMAVDPANPLRPKRRSLVRR